MIQVTPQMRILVAVDPVDFRRGIDGLARLCKEVLKQDPGSSKPICTAITTATYTSLLAITNR